MSGRHSHIPVGWEEDADMWLVRPQRLDDDTSFFTGLRSTWGFILNGFVYVREARYAETFDLEKKP